MECVFYPIWDVTIPLCDDKIYDTVFATEARKGKSRKFKYVVEVTAKYDLSVDMS